MTAKKFEPHLPFVEPPEHALADIYAVKALWAGTANDGQQRRAIRWIVEQAAAVGDDPWRADTRLTDHLVGRQSVGRMILKLVNSVVKEDPNG